MNYIKEINSFYDWLETNSVSDSVITLWHALMHINNKTGWKVEFTVAVSTLQVKTGLSSASIKRSRNILAQLGRIKWKQRSGNQSSIYEIVPFADHSDPQCIPECVPESVPQSVPQCVPINKLNKTKLKEEEEKKEKPSPSNFKKLTIQNFHEELKSYTSEFSIPTVSAFFNYWSEKDSNGKMKFQRENTWETKKRLIMWKNKEAKWNS